MGDWGKTDMKAWGAAGFELLLKSALANVMYTVWSRSWSGTVCNP